MSAEDLRSIANDLARIDLTGFASVVSRCADDYEALSLTAVRERARAEKAEQERDEALAQIDAHLNLCNGAPMTTVDEDGRVWRVEIVPNGEAQSHMPGDPWLACRLVPIEETT